ncbi:MAG: hypothetical protein H0T68_00615 [Gemmatimonadales bacterium]|nr:hypothetical protein [Gemmatimonadales bacterium]
MPSYAAFGGCLDSDISFPELIELPASLPTWTLRTSSAAPDASPGEHLGQDQVDGEVLVRLYRNGGGYRLRFDDTGIFEVSADGSRIRWFPAGREPDEATRIDVLGRVLALAMHAGGMFCLHGSAVTMGDGAVAFLAPKLHGKSTLALALALAGGRLMGDDTIALDLAGGPSVRPGVHGVRLWADSAARLTGDTGGRSAGGKGVFEVLTEDQLMRSPAPLRAIYLLAPVPSDAGPPARRKRLEPVPAALSLVSHAKLGSLLGKGETGVLVRWAAAVVRTTPVYVFELMRDFDRLPEIVRQLQAWHAGAHAAVAEPALP